MFYFRLNRIKVFDNYVQKAISKRDRADVEILSFINSESSLLPQLKCLTSAKTHAKQKDIVSSAVDTAINARVLTPVENVRDHHELLFGDTGYVLFQADAIPECLHWQMVVVGSKAKLRDKANMAQDVIKGKDFDPFVKNLALLAGSAANPIAAASLEIGKFITGIVLQAYANKRDDMLGLVYQSWNRREHYLHGERKKDDQPDLTGNVIYDYSIFGFDNRNA
jgi:hypothetical protein